MLFGHIKDNLTLLHFCDRLFSMREEMVRLKRVGREYSYKDYRISNIGNRWYVWGPRLGDFKTLKEVKIFLYRQGEKRQV